MNEQYKTAVDKLQSEYLPSLQGRLSAALKEYVPDAAVTLQWDGASVKVEAPRTSAWLDDGFAGEVEGKGHGLQRLFLISLLQVAATLATDRAAGSSPDESGSAEDGGSQVVLAIEEPELYQHPLQARRFFSTLQALATGRGPAMQILYCTHSPWFVSVERFEDIRLARKVEAGARMPKTTKLTKVDLVSVMRRIENAFRAKAGFASKRFMSQMATIMDGAVNEGLFARSVVLVEGVEDQAIVVASLRLAGVDPDHVGLAVIPVLGKRNLDRPYVVFDQLGINTYLIFDADQDKKDPDEKTSKALLRLVETPPIHTATVINDKVAMFDSNFIKVVRQEVGEDEFDYHANLVAVNFGWEGSRTTTLKSPQFIHELLRKLKGEERTSPSLSRITEIILHRYCDS